VLPPPRNREHVSSYARIVNSCLEGNLYLHISIRLPIYDPSSIFHLHTSGPPSLGSISATSFLSSPSPRSQTLDNMSPMSLTPRFMVSNSSSGASSPATREGSLDAMWEMWDTIRSICDYHPRLSLGKNSSIHLALPSLIFLPALDLTPPLPTTLGVLDKWSAEAVRYIFLPCSTFIANTKGYPVLPKPTQNFIRDSIAASIIILNAPCLITTVELLLASSNLRCIWSYFRIAQSWRGVCLPAVYTTLGENK
jgi:protein arginine N-methyltransferase 5